MIKNVYKISALLLLLTTIVLSSCSESLELEPKQSIRLEKAISSESNLKALLIGSYNDLGAESRTGSNASLSGTSQLISDLLGNTGNVSWEGTFVAPRQLNNKQVLVDNDFILTSWTASYKAINQVNLILDNLNIVTDVKAKKLMEGESKFLRALAYFDLVRIFAKPFEAGTDNNQKGVPLRLKGITDYKGDLSIARSSVKEVYNQIIEDLNSAYALLPASNSFYADKYAAKALLARVYLQQQDYANARDAANDVIKNSGHSLEETFAKAFNNDSNSREDVFAFQITDQAGSSRLITFYASQADGGRGGDIIVNKSYYNSFDAKGVDERSTFSKEGLTSKYTNQYANISIFRLAEMYLIRAEANFRENTSVGATPLKDINTIRTRSKAPELTSINIDLILKERNYELAFEGFLLHDLKRTKKKIGNLDYNSDKLVMPIPQSEKDANKKIEQNPGYDK